MQVCAGDQVFQYIVAQEVLDFALRGGALVEETCGVGFHEFFGRAEHPGRHQVQGGARNQAGQDGAGPGFADRVGRDKYVGKFFGHKK